MIDCERNDHGFSVTRLIIGLAGGFSFAFIVAAITYRYTTHRKQANETIRKQAIYLKAQQKDHFTDKAMAADVSKAKDNIVCDSDDSVPHKVYTLEVDSDQINQDPMQGISGNIVNEHRDKGTYTLQPESGIYISNANFVQISSGDGAKNCIQ